MRRFTRHTVIICLAAALVVLPVVSSFAVSADTALSTEEEGPSLGAVCADMAIVRPLGAASTVLGLFGYVVSLPFSIPGDNNDAVWDRLVVDPAEYTFKRPIGEF